MSSYAPELTHAQAIVARLEQIEADLADRQSDLETYATDWFKAKRDRERKWAEAFMKAAGTVDARRAQATLQSIDHGIAEEAAYEAVKAVCRVLDTRASVLMALLKAMPR